jgi:hypothetical protein
MFGPGIVEFILSLSYSFLALIISTALGLLPKLSSLAFSSADLFYFETADVLTGLDDLYLRDDCFADLFFPSTDLPSGVSLYLIKSLSSCFDVFAQEQQPVLEPIFIF